MNVTIEIPDAIAGVLANPEQDPARAVLEAVALEGYRSDRLSEYQVQQLLGFRYFGEVHAFLKQHGAYLNYSMEDLDQDFASALELAQRVRQEAWPL